METKIYTRCLRCNRILKTETARKRGYGNYCWKLNQINITKNKPTLLDKYNAHIINI